MLPVPTVAQLVELVVVVEITIVVLAQGSLLATVNEADPKHPFELFAVTEKLPAAKPVNVPLD